MHDVGQPPRAIGIAQQLVGTLGFGGLEDASDQRCDARPLPFVKPATEPFRPGVPGAVVVLQGRKYLRAQPEHVTRQGAPGARGGLGLGDCPEHAFKLLGFAACENVLDTDLDTGDAALVQRRSHPAALVRLAYQHRDVRTLDRLPVQGRLSFAR